MTKTSTVLCAALIGAGLILAGCSGASTKSAPGGGTTTTTVDTHTKPRSGSGAGVEDRATKPIVQQVVASPEAPADKATVGIQSLTVEGKTMVLRLVITPHFASVSDTKVVSLGDAMNVGPQFFGVNLRLLDRKNLKEYSVISKGNDWWASASDDVGSMNGKPMYAFAVFAAPEDAINTIDVRINEQWPDFTGVPITR